MKLTATWGEMRRTQVGVDRDIMARSRHADPERFQLKAYACANPIHSAREAEAKEFLLWKVAIL